MNRRFKGLPFFAILFLFPAMPTFAQPMLSPEINPDHTVTFRLKATNATEVQLSCEGVNETNMVKNEQGVWSLTSRPLEPDIYAYSFHVDGLQFTDPKNSLFKYNLLNSESLLHVPGPPTLPWEINDVPRGQVHRQ